MSGPRERYLALCVACQHPANQHRWTPDHEHRASTTAIEYVCQACGCTDVAEVEWLTRGEWNDLLAGDA